MFVSSFYVFPFNFVKKPIICALWYAVLVHLILDPFSSPAIIISSAILAISFITIRFYLAIFSFVPMIASVIICSTKYPSLLIYFLIAAAIWSILCVIALIVTVRVAKDIYTIDPATGILYKN